MVIDIYTEMILEKFDNLANVHLISDRKKI